MKYFKQFNHKLKPMGLVLRDVEADGNCLFRAIADQLTGDEDNYNKYRQLTIKQLKRNQHFFHDFLPEGFTIKSYTSRMSEDGVWGGHMELQAISDALQLDIVVHTIDNYYIITHKVHIDCWQSIKEKLCLRIGKQTKPKHRQIHIAFHSGKKIINHYSSVRMIDDDSCKQAKQPQLFCQPSEQSTTDDSY